jgi:hypothetical protein
MATVQEIETARQAAVRNADAQIVEAIARRNGSSSSSTRGKLNDLLDSLMTARTAQNAKAVEAEDSSEEMKDALEALEKVTINMRRVAEHEKRLAEFLTLASAFATAGAKLAGAIKQGARTSSATQGGTQAKT